MKRMIFSLLLMLLWMVLVACGDSYESKTSYDSPDEAANLACVSSGGSWDIFPTACTDDCSAEPRELCATVLTRDCNCGPGRCYLEGECVDNPPWHVPAP